MGLLDRFKKYKREEDRSLDIFEKVASSEEDLTQNIPQQPTSSFSFQENIATSREPVENRQLQQTQYSQPTYNTPNYYQQYSQSYSEQYSSFDWESYIQAIAEKVFDDKIKVTNEKIEELRIWKEKMELELEKIKEDLEKLSKKMDDLQDLLMRKIEDYDKGIKEATVEVQALHKLVRTMVPAISESVKELRETIEEIKLMRDRLRTP